MRLEMRWRNFLWNLDRFFCYKYMGIGEDGWATLARLLPGLNVRVGCLLAQQEDFEQGSAKDLRTIWEALGSAGNGGMLHLYDHEGSDIEITWNTEEEKKEKWEEVAEIWGLAEQAEEQGGEDEGLV